MGGTEMDKQATLEEISKAIIELDIDAMPELCKKAVMGGIPAYEVVVSGMAKGMNVVGEKYEAGEYYLAELIMAGETMKEGMKILEPHLKKGAARSAGKCVIGTVKGDLHDIGKNVFVTLLKAQNYDVIDLGVDVSPSMFAKTVKEHKPNLVAMSALLTTTMGEMENVVLELKRQGLRDDIKVIIGGAPLTQRYAEKIGADAAAHDAVEGIRIISHWSGIN
jgi:5-methyltetrahydrofolate--homocysteine methyltransferase